MALLLYMELELLPSISAELEDQERCGLVL